MKTSDYKYAAFISYRHVEPDRSEAKWLYEALLSYRVPATIASPHVEKRRLGRIFRDNEEIEAGPSVREKLHEKLRESRFLIVVCSPRTPARDVEHRLVRGYIDLEVEHFRELGRAPRIIPLIIEGEPDECFPVALRPEAGAALGAEPLAADIRPVGENAAYSPKERRRRQLLRIVAAMLGVDFESLCQQDAARRRKERTRNLSLAGAVALLVAGLLFAYVRQSSVAERAVSAKTALALAEASERESERNGFESAALLARASWLHARDHGGPSLAAADRALRRALLDGPLCQEAPLPAGHEVAAVAIDAEAEVVAAAAVRGGVEEEKAPGRVLLWKLPRMEPIGGAALETDPAPFWVGFSADGKWLVAALTDGSLRVWSRGNLEAPPVRPAFTVDRGSRPAISPRGATIAIPERRRLRLLDLGGDRNAPIELGELPKGDAYLAFGEGGDVVAAATEGAGILYWKISFPPRPLTLKGEGREGGEDRFPTLAFVPGRLLAGTMSWEEVSWGLGGGEPGRARRRPIASAGLKGFGAAFVASGGGLVVASGGLAEALLWDPREPVLEPRILRGLAANLAGAAIDPRGARAVVTDRKSVRVWHTDLRVARVRFPDETLSEVDPNHEDFAREVAGKVTGGIRALAFRPASPEAGTPAELGAAVGGGFPTGGMTGGRSLEFLRLAPSDLLRDAARVEFQSTIRMDFRAGGSAGSFLAGLPVVHAIGFSGDGVYCAVATGPDVIAWNTGDWEGDIALRRGGGGDEALAFDPRPGEFALVAGGAGGFVTLWERSGDDIGERRLGGSTGPVAALAVSGDGATIAAGGADGRIHLWRRADPAAEPVSLGGHSGRVGSLAFRPGGSLLASGGDDGTIRLWEVEGGRGRQVASIAPGLGAIRALAFPSARHLAAGTGTQSRGGVAMIDRSSIEDMPGSVLLVDLEAPRDGNAYVAMRIARYEDPVTALAADPASGRIAVGTEGRVVEMLPASAEWLAEEVLRRLGREWSEKEWRRYAGPAE